MRLDAHGIFLIAIMLKALPTPKLRCLDNGFTVHVSTISSTIRHGTANSTSDTGVRDLHLCQSFLQQMALGLWSQISFRGLSIYM